MKTVSLVTEKTYKKVVKPILFKIDPEKVHNGTVSLSKATAKLPIVPNALYKLWSFQSEILEQEIDGVKYLNPIGLAGGYDKNAELTNFMPYLGMGFMEVGSITAEYCSGNIGKRLWRMPNSKSILVYYGLKNDGADAIYSRIKTKNFKIPVGINIAKTNNKDTCEDNNAIADYAYSFKKFKNNGSFYTINISCPNAYGGQPFTDKTRLNKLLTELDKLDRTKPVYIKLSPDIDYKTRQEMAKASFNHNIQGFICSNITKNRNNEMISDTVQSDNGGFSGKVVENLTNQLISDMYKLTNGSKTIIGCGGIFDAEDAYKKIKLGASLLEMITGLIFEGPQVVGKINRELVQLLKADGYKNIAEAVGSDIK